VDVLRELEPLATTPAAYVFAGFLGLLWGSFANVCIYRWPPSEEFPKGRSVVAPGSHCFVCKTPIKWYDNAPIIAWLWLRGKCRSCKAPFSSRYLIVEALTGLLFALAWWFTVTVGAYFEPFDQRLIRFVIYAAFCFVMVVITFIDIDHKLILDKLTYPSIVIFFGLGFLLAGHPWYVGLIGAIAGYALPWAVGETYYLVAGRDGLGLGDAKLLALVGALLGVKGVVASLFGGALVGAVAGVLLLMRGTGGAKRGASSAVFAVVAMGVATFGAFTNRVVLGAVGSVAAIGALVLSRRFAEPIDEAAADTSSETGGGPDADAVPDAAGDSDAVGGKLLAARVMALVGAVFVLSAVTFELLSWHWGALGAGVMGIGLVFLATRMVPAPTEELAEEPPPEEGPSLMRTELPFGPFLALAAVVYLFAEPWILVNFRLPGG